MSFWYLNTFVRIAYTYSNWGSHHLLTFSDFIQFDCPGIWHVGSPRCQGQTAQIRDWPMQWQWLHGQYSWYTGMVNIICLHAIRTFCNNIILLFCSTKCWSVSVPADFIKENCGPGVNPCAWQSKLHTHTSTSNLEHSTSIHTAIHYTRLEIVIISTYAYRPTHRLSFHSYPYIIMKFPTRSTVLVLLVLIALCAAQLSDHTPRSAISTSADDVLPRSIPYALDRTKRQRQSQKQRLTNTRDTSPNVISSKDIGSTASSVGQTVDDTLGSLHISIIGIVVFGVLAALFVIILCCATCSRGRGQGCTLC